MTDKKKMKGVKLSNEGLVMLIERPLSMTGRSSDKNSQMTAPSP